MVKITSHVGDLVGTIFDFAIGGNLAAGMKSAAAQKAQDFTFGGTNCSLPEKSMQ